MEEYAQAWKVLVGLPYPSTNKDATNYHVLNSTYFSCQFLGKLLPGIVLTSELYVQP